MFEKLKAEAGEKFGYFPSHFPAKHVAAHLRLATSITRSPPLLTCGLLGKGEYSHNALWAKVEQDFSIRVVTKQGRRRSGGGAADATPKEAPKEAVKKERVIMRIVSTRPSPIKQPKQPAESNANAALKPSGVVVEEETTNTVPDDAFSPYRAQKKYFVSFVLALQPSSSYESHEFNYTHIF
jgi:hypothetical protein